MVELKPCPFCGHNPLTYQQTGLIECCYSMCGVNPRSASCEDWNSRVSDRIVEENAELREALMDMVDGYDKYELVGHTGLSQDRCQAIIDLAKHK